jgi:hypothetical protein
MAQTALGHALGAGRRAVQGLLPSFAGLWRLGNLDLGFLGLVSDGHE